MQAVLTEIGLEESGLFRLVFYTTRSELEGLEIKDMSAETYTITQNATEQEQ